MDAAIAPRVTDERLNEVSLLVDIGEAGERGRLGGQDPIAGDRRSSSHRSRDRGIQVLANLSRTQSLLLVYPDLQVSCRPCVWTADSA